jgi:hypothetical protein
MLVTFFTAGIVAYPRLYAGGDILSVHFRMNFRGTFGGEFSLLVLLILG